MVHNVEEAVRELEQHPENLVETIVGGIVVEMRFKRRKTAADIFREIGPWKGESYEQITALLSEARGADSKSKTGFAKNPNRMSFIWPARGFRRSSK